MTRALWLSFSLIAVVLADARAADICEAVVVRSVPALENPDAVLEAGEINTAVTQYRVNKKTGETWLCSHGGYCYPTHVYANGIKLEALQLTNCTVGKDRLVDDPEEIIYGLDVIRGKVSRTDLKIDDLENELIEIGLCSACASNVAELTINQPASRCAQLTREALGGDAASLDTLIAFPDYCRAW